METPEQDTAPGAPEPPVAEDTDALSEDEERLLGAGEAPAPAMAAPGTRARIVAGRPADVEELEAALAMAGVEVEKTAAVADAEPADGVLTILVADASNSRVPGMIRELAIRGAAGALLLATRNPTPGLVFQAARAGADYVVVLPPSPEAVERILQLGEARLAA